MFKAARWRSDKNKIKAVFKLQFTATQVHGLGWEPLVVTLVPVEIGKPSVRSEKATAADGECQWLNPVYETVRLTQDQKTGKINEKLCQFLVSTAGSAKSRVLGETTINLADYFDVFKPYSVSLPLQGSTIGAILHVTVQRMQGDVEGRETDENGDAKRQRKTLKSQLSFPENDEYNRVANGANDVDINEEGTFVNSQSSNVLMHVDSGDSLTKSSSFDAISASGSESSSGLYTPKQNGIKNNNNTHQESASLLSPLSNSGTPRNIDWAVSSAPDGSISGSTNSSGEAENLQETKKSSESGNVLKKQKSDLNTLARQLEVSDLELQTLRKQVVKESRRGQDISRELSSLKEERDTLRRELEELKASKKRISAKENVLTRLQIVSNDPWSMLEEMKEELDHEKNLNANLRLQLEKTQESNSELIFAVRDLEELLERKNIEASEDTQEKETRDQKPHMSCGIQQESFETTSEHDEQYTMEVLIKECHDAKGVHSQEQMIIDLSSELELYKKDREDLEMQMEQLALDYEILKQENHDISSRLEQIQLREQLRMQYECSAHLVIINDLEIHVESLEAELQKQAEVFEANLAATIQEKVGQERRAIEAEELLRKTRWNSANTAEELQEEVRRLAGQMSSTFNATEKLVLQKLTEYTELNLQKNHLEELLERTNMELTSVKHQHHMKCQQLLSLIDFKTKEADRLYLELKDKREELEIQRKSEVERQKTSSNEMSILKAEMEQLLHEKDCLSEQIAQKEKLVAEIEELKASTSSIENLLKETNLEKEALVEQLSVMREEAKKLLEEHSALKHLKDDQDETIKLLKSEAGNLREQYTGLKRSVFDDELEKENLRKQVFLLRGDLQEEADIIASIEKKLRGNNVKLTVTDGTTKKSVSKKNRSVVATRGSQEEPVLNENSESLEVIRLNEHGSDIHEDEQDTCTRFEQLSRSHLQADTAAENKFKSDDMNVVKINGDHMLETNMADKASENQAYDFDGKQVKSKLHKNRKKEGDSSKLHSCELHNVAEIIGEMVNLREQNEFMAAELKEMQERYSEMSLKFAEVEGERQQLVITIRMLKNSLKN